MTPKGLEAPAPSIWRRKWLEWAREHQDALHRSPTSQFQRDELAKCITQARWWHREYMTRLLARSR